MASAAQKKVMLKEFIKCANDPVYFMGKYCYIIHQAYGKILFKPYEFQKRTLREMQEHRFNIILKARQMGISTLVAGYSLWLMLFHDDKHISCLSFRRDTAKNIVTKAKKMHDELPSWMQERKVKDNTLSMTFGNGSRIWAESTGPNAGRSESLSLLILDEAAFIRNAEEIWSSIKLTLDVGKGRAIVLSTPAGVGNWYHKIWTGAIDGAKKVVDRVDGEVEHEIWEGTGINDFHPIKLHWSLHPEREIEWREEQDRTLGPRRAARECDCNFETSGNNVISMETITWYRDNIVKEPQYKRRVMGEETLWVWKDPDPRKEYVLSADVARGDAGDYSAFQIWDVKEMELCAELKQKIPPEEFGDLCAMYGSLYNNALIIVERNNYGRATLRRIIERDYKNVFYSSNNLNEIDVMNKNLDYYAEQRKMKPGFDTNSKTRPELISKFNDYLRTREVKIYSSRYIEELQTFIWKTPTKAEHMDGYNDDLIFASVSFFWVRDTALAWNQKQRDVSEQTLGSISRSTDSFGNRGSNDQKKSSGTRGIFNASNRQSQNPYKMNTGKTGMDDIRWLLD